MIIIHVRACPGGVGRGAIGLRILPAVPDVMEKLLEAAQGVLLYPVPPWGRGEKGDVTLLSLRHISDGSRRERSRVQRALIVVRP